MIRFGSGSTVKEERSRFERFYIFFHMLLAGWVHSVLVLIVSYTIVSSTLETRILRDRQTVVQLIGHTVGDDLSRTSGIIDYYQSAPETQRILSGSVPQPAAQQWVASAFYSQPRIDGMFLTNADGRLIAAVPPDQNMIGKDYGSGYWREGASSMGGTYVSPVHARFSDNRMATDLVGAIRGPNGIVTGYFGLS